MTPEIADELCLYSVGMRRCSVGLSVLLPSSLLKTWQAEEGFV